MAQIDLTPFLPGPLSKHIIETFYKCAPDASKNNPLAVKILTAEIINIACNVYINDYPSPKPASMYIILIGEPKTGKGTLIKIFASLLKAVDDAARYDDSLGIKFVISATAEGLRDELATAVKTKKGWRELGPQGRVIHIWERATPPDSSQFYETMAEILEGAWDSIDLSKSRVTEGLPKKVEAGSYFFSLVWDCHPERWNKVFRNLGGDYGTARRMLPIYMRGELPDLSKPPLDLIDELILRSREFANMVRPLQPYAVLVDLPDMSGISEVIRRSTLKREERHMIVEYLRRLTASWIIDILFPHLRSMAEEAFTGLQGSPLGLSRCIPLFDSPSPAGRKIERDATATCNQSSATWKLTCKPSVNFCKHCKHLMLLTMEVYKSPVTTCKLVNSTALTWFKLLEEHYGASPSLEDEVTARFAKKADEFFYRLVNDEKYFRDRLLPKYGHKDKSLRFGKPCCSKSTFWIEVIGGRKAREANDIFKTLIGIGRITIRKVGSSEVVMPSWARLCGTCALYDEGCPNMDSRAGIRPDPRDEPCELYRPVEV